MTEFKPQKLLFGLKLDTAKKIKDKVETEILRKYPEMQTVCRYRKEGIYQYLKEQEHILVIMEENLQGGSGYTPAELQQLTDLGNSRIIFLMDRAHSGDDYVKALYGCGISDGLYLEEAAPREVLSLVFHARSQEEARKYYGIQVLRDAEKAEGIVNEEKLGAYLEYIEDEAENRERGDKYRFVSTRLGAEENRILAANISGEVARSLAGNEVFAFYRGGVRGKRRFLKRRKRTGEAESVAVPQKPLMASSMEEPKGHLRMDAKETDEIVSDNGEDEMLCAMDRFWAAGGKDTACADTGDKAELLAMFAGYLKTIDT